MAISVTHTFVSPVADAGNPDEVGPNEWNAAHTISGLGTAAEADSTDFATAAQGALADTAVQPAAIANMLETSDIGVSVQAHSAVLDATTASFLTAQETKLGHITVTQAVDLDAIETAAAASKIKTDFITVTQAVDLDAIETRVNALDAAVVLKGSWDASAGTFPGGGTAQAGDSYIVSVAGTVNSVAFALNDRIIAITDNASTTVFAANWFKADYTDQVLSVDGQTGAVSLSAVYQPLDSDLTAISALSTQTFGRARLTDAAAEDARNALDTAPYVATRTALKALDTTKDTIAILTETGRAGTFLWTAGNFTARVAADTLEGIYVKADAISAGSGAWVRLFAYSVSPKWWGAAADNSTDDQAALNAAMAVDYPMYVDGLYKTSAAITYAGSVSKVVFGNGNAASRITTTSATADILVKNSSGSLILRDVGISTTVDKSAGSAVRLIGSGSRSLIENCMIYGADATHALYIGVNCETELIPTIRSNYILSCKIDAIRLTQTGGAGGEAIVYGNTINTAVATPTNAAAVHWLSGVGTLIVAANRVQSYGYGVLYQPADGETTASLIVADNAFENNISQSIALFLPSSGTALMQSVVVSGNRFYNPSGGCFATAGATNTDWIDAITLVGNEFKFGINYPINIGAGNSFQESGNTFYATTGSLTAILTAAAIPLVGQCSSPRAAFVGVATRYALNANPNVITPDSTAPVTKTADFTVGLAESNIISNRGATNTATLPAAASFAGREIKITTIQAFTVVSASSNVVPKAGGAAGTAILPATDGAWATLVSDGTNWIIMQAGT